MDELLKDSRFAHVANDPKYRRVPKAEKKVKIDKRFQGMFKNKNFVVKCSIDKRGRPVNHTSTENLRKYYDISSSEEESEDEEEEEEAVPDKIEKQQKKAKVKEQSKKKEKKKKKKKEIPASEVHEEEEEESNQVADSDNDSSDNNFSSNGELLRIKQKQQSEEESEGVTESDSDTDEKSQKADLNKDENQLYVRRKNEDTKLSEKVKEKLRDLTVNYARGEGVLLTDSSSEEESSEESEEEEIEHDWGELDKDAETTDEVTHRLAVCNMDWDRIRAVDLMVLFNSFLPSGGLIRSVTIYPSEFGLQRMKEEEVSGPPELTETKCESDGEEEENEEGSEYHMEKLRKYQLNRLKYYYAVVEFDSEETANKVYTECDGLEYESTATKLDLRFVPKDMEFDQEPKEVCDQLPELSKYEPRQFTTTALQQVKVELTWDETNPERQEFAQKLNSGKLDEIKDSDLHAYLASDTSDDESEKEENVEADKSDGESNADPIEKYKSLLKEIEEKEEAKRNKDVELEFTWGLGEKEKAEKLVQERMKKDQNLTPFEQYLEKRKAKRKAKREEKKKLKDGNAEAGTENSDLSDTDLSDTEMPNGKHHSGKKDASDEDEERHKAELELLLMDENADDKRHFNMKKIEENATMSKSKQKRLSKKKDAEDIRQGDDFEVDVKDPRFNALFTSHHFNIDPADPHFRKTKGTEALIKEKLKRRADDDVNEEVKEKQPKVDKKLNTELQTLVKSVKKKSQNISRPIK